MGGCEFNFCFLRKGSKFFRVLVVANHAGFCDRGQFHAMSTSGFQFIYEVKAKLVELACCHGCANDISVKQFFFKLNGYINHDDPYSFERKLCVTMMRQELHPGLMNQRQESVISNVTSIVYVGYAY